MMEIKNQKLNIKIKMNPKLLINLICSISLICVISGSDIFPQVKKEKFGNTYLTDSAGAAANWYRITGSNVSIPESLWVGRWLTVGKTSGGIRLDTNGLGQIYYNGYDLNIINKKYGFVNITSEGQDKGIILNALGNGATQSYWIGEGNSSFGWNKSEEQTGIELMKLDTSGLRIGGDITGRPQINAKGRLDKVHYSFVNDTNTGFHRLGPDSVGIVTNTTSRFIIGSTVMRSDLAHYFKAGVTFDESGGIPGPDLTAGNQFRLYMKGNKMIIAYETGGPSGLEYWFLDLTSQTDQQWTYSSEEP